MVQILAFPLSDTEEILNSNTSLEVRRWSGGLGVGLVFHASPEALPNSVVH